MKIKLILFNNNILLLRDFIIDSILLLNVVLKINIEAQYVEIIDDE